MLTYVDPHYRLAIGFQLCPCYEEPATGGSRGTAADQELGSQLRDVE